MRRSSVTDPAETRRPWAAFAPRAFPVQARLATNPAAADRQDLLASYFERRSLASSLERREVRRPVQRRSENGGLPEAVRAKMEHAFASDFSEVRIDPSSPKAAEIGAWAYAQGETVHFAPGKFQPRSQAGQRLIAHELAHVVQQRQGRVRPTARLGGLPVNAEARLEQEADRLATRATRDQAVSMRAKPATRGTACGRDEGRPIQGFWGELILTTLLGAIGWAWGGPVPAAIGALSGLAIGRALGGSGSPKQAVQFHVKRMDEHLDSEKKTDYTEDYKTIKKMAANDPGFSFDDGKEEIRISYNFLQLKEIYGGQMRLYLNDMVPKAFRKYSQEEAITRAFRLPTATKEEEKSKQELFEKSEKRAETFDYREYDKAFDDEKIDDCKKTLKKLSSEEAAAFLLSNSQGLVLGELHSETGSKQFLVEKMKALAEAGVDTLYLEHLRDDYQEMLDLWNQKQQKMPEQLEKAVQGIDEGQNLTKEDFNILKVMRAANSAGIRIVGIDSLAAQYVESPGAGEELRALTMNVFAEDVILKDRKQRVGKYVILTGQKHSHTHPGGEAFTKVKTLPGLSQLLRIPAVTYQPKSDKLVLDVDQYQQDRRKLKEKVN